MRTDVLVAELERLDRDGRVPKFIYTVPSFQNPAGVTLALERRQELVRIAKERELLVLEDNPYGLLRYSGEPLPTLYALDGAEYVIYLGTFSKILSPGLRLGWAAAPRPVLDKLNLGKGGGSTSARLPFRSSSWRPTSPSATGARTCVSCRALPAGGDRDARGARRAPAARGDWDRADGGCSSGRSCRTTSTRRPAARRCARRRVRAGRARLSGRRGGLGDAAELLRRREGTSRGRAADRQGLREQVGLYSTLPGAPRCAAGGAPRTCIELRRRADEGRGPEGRPLARRQVSLRSGAASRTR